MPAPRKYFGTDGIRGPYGGPLLNETFARRLGVAAARLVRGVNPAGGLVLIGRDTRASGAALTRALAAGLMEGGLRPVELGVIPTPAVSLAVRRKRAVLGVTVTASHNPAADNGIKFFGPSGAKLSETEEAHIEGLLPAAVGSAEVSPVRLDFLQDYRAAMEAILPAGSLMGWKIVLDAAHGATCETSPAVLRRLGAELILLGAGPDGTNINAGVGSEYPEELGRQVRTASARLGIAHDGDGDRCLLSDELGRALDGDEILTILALHALAQGELARNLLVVTEQSNLGVDAAVQTAGGRVVRTPVGDRHVAERMRAESANLGGESSGHIICADIAPTGDGLVAALKVIGVMRTTGKPLSELRRGLKKFPQFTAALTVREKKPLEELPTLAQGIRETQSELGTKGRVLVRYSGTEPKLRLLVEGPKEDIVQSHLARLLAAARADLDVLD